MALRVTIKCYGMINLTIPANPQPMYPYAERLNYITLDSAAGTQYVLNAGPTRVNASIIWKGVDYSIVQKYEDFLLNYAKFGLNPFDIVCPDYIDFGLGKGQDIIKAHYSGKSNIKDVISTRDSAGLFFDIELPYIFVRY